MGLPAHDFSKHHFSFWPTLFYGSYTTAQKISLSANGESLLRNKVQLQVGICLMCFRSERERFLTTLTLSPGNVSIFVGLSIHDWTALCCFVDVQSTVQELVKLAN